MINDENNKFMTTEYSKDYLSEKDEAGNTRWWNFTSKVGRDSELVTKHFLEVAYPQYVVKYVADANISWDLEIRYKANPYVEPCKVDVKHSASWLNVSINFKPEAVKYSQADIFIFNCDSNPNGNQYLIIETEALKNCPEQLKTYRVNPAGQQYVQVKYKDMKQFCLDNNYQFVYRSVRF